MTNLDSIFKSRDITLPTKVHLVKAMVFPVVMYGWESWTVKKAEWWRIDAFELWCWRRLLRVPWTTRRSSSQSYRRSILNIHWKDWCWSWSSNTLATWWLTHWKRPWFWERLKAEGKACLVKAMVFPVVMYGCEHQRIDAFELWCWRTLLRVPWTARRSNHFTLKEISPECSLEGLMLRLKLPILWPPHWGQAEKGMTKDEMVGWHHWLDGHEFE